MMWSIFGVEEYVGVAICSSSSLRGGSGVLGKLLLFRVPGLAFLRLVFGGSAGGMSFKINGCDLFSLNMDSKKTNNKFIGK